MRVKMARGDEKCGVEMVCVCWLAAYKLAPGTLFLRFRKFVGAVGVVGETAKTTVS